MMAEFGVNTTTTVHNACNVSNEPHTSYFGQQQPRTNRNSKSEKRSSPVSNTEPSWPQVSAIILALHHSVPDLEAACGMCTPREMPTGTLTQRETVAGDKSIDHVCTMAPPKKINSLHTTTHPAIIRYGSSWWMEQFKSPALRAIYFRVIHAMLLFPKHGIQLLIEGNAYDIWTLVDICVKSNLCAHAIRICWYYMRTSWTGPTGSFGETPDTVKSCMVPRAAVALIHTIRNAIHDTPVKYLDHSISLLRRLTMLISGNNPRQRPVNNTTQYEFLHRVTMAEKRVPCQATNDLVTNRWITAPKNIRKVIEPDVNFAWRLAAHEIIRHECTKLTMAQIMNILVYTRRALVRIPAVREDVDFISLYAFIVRCLISRLRTKLIVVNKPRCTCHAKCIGPLGSVPTLEKRIWGETVELHGALIVCGACNLSYVVENPASDKARRCVAVRNPEVEMCSIDMCTSFKQLRLIQLDLIMSKNRHIHLRCAHLFYTTNSVNITDELNNTSLSGPQARNYGTCFSGSRKCFKRFVIKSPSPRNNEPRIPATNHEFWHRCKQCASLGPTEFVLDSSLAFSDQDPNSCMHHYCRSTVSADSMCRGCRAAATCYHVPERLVAQVDTLRSISNGRPAFISLLKKVKLIYELRNILSTATGWPGLIDDYDI